MTFSAFAAPAAPPAPDGGYVPGVCNIGPDEIARRRRAGHLGALVTLALFIVLLALDVPYVVRFAVALPAAGAAVGYLQAWLEFCAGFGSIGVFNFGALGQTELVDDPAARARDRARARQIFAGGVAIGLLVGGLAALLPL